MLPPLTVTDENPVANEEPLREEHLGNGLTLRFYERTNRYFGDYHRVCIEVVTVLDLAAPALAELAPPQLAAARTRFGSILTLRRTLERMGVPGAAVAAVAGELIDAYLVEARRYQARPDYPARLLRSELERKTTPVLLPRLR